LKSQLGAADIITPYNISGNTMSTAILYPGPDLPFPMSGHCMVNINNSMIMIIVGYYSNNDYSRQTFFMDIESETFIKGPIQNYGRTKLQCSLIQNTVGPPAILVTGQHQIVLDDPPDFGDILYLNNSNNWLAGPNTTIYGNSRILRILRMDFLCRVIKKSYLFQILLTTLCSSTIFAVLIANGN
jgi:hypothetical protein